MSKFKTYLDRLSIVAKFPDKKWDLQRWHYIVKIGDETFDYRGSAKEYEDEIGKMLADRMVNPSSIVKKKYGNVKLMTDDDIKTDVLYALTMDFQSYLDCKDEREFIEQYGYNDKPKEGIMIWQELEKNHEKMNRVFSAGEIEELIVLYSDY